METQLKSSDLMETRRFKSYYVVWKLKYIYDKEKINKQFKSYYVVWKPQNEK